MKRKDGTRYRGADMLYTIVPFIMVKRSDTCNALTVHLPYNSMHDYIAAKRAQGVNLSYMTLFIAAYVRTVAKYPALNRFIVNKRIYSRSSLTVAMVVQRADGAEGTMSKLDFELTDTVFDVNRKIMEFVNGNREEDTNDTDGIMRRLTGLMWLMPFAIGLLKWADKHGLLPKAVLKASPFHASMVISNLASIRTNHIYHHIYDFGTISQIITMGNLEYVIKERDGKTFAEKQLPLGIVCDERIASGYYYSKCFREIQSLLNHPERLELPPVSVVTD